MKFVEHVFGICGSTPRSIETIFPGICSVAQNRAQEFCLDSDRSAKTSGRPCDRHCVHFRMAECLGVMLVAACRDIGVGKMESFPGSRANHSLHDQDSDTPFLRSLDFANSHPTFSNLRCKKRCKSRLVFGCKNRFKNRCDCWCEI